MSTAIAPIELSTTELDQLCSNTIRTLSIDAVQQAIPGIQEHPWRWRRWFTPSGTARSSTIRKIRSGPIATVSCFQMDLTPCCSGQLSVSQLSER